MSGTASYQFVEMSKPSLQHDRVEACTTETPFDELQHGSELTEDDRLESLFLAAEFVEIINKHLNLGR